MAGGCEPATGKFAWHHWQTGLSCADIDRMGRKRKLTSHQKQLRFFAFFFGGLLVLFLVVILVFFNSRTPGH
jgi:hypothetical protein